MINQSKAKIFLAEERGLHETSCFRSMLTFNSGNYFNEHKIPFNDIYLINDDTLAGGRSLSRLIPEDSYIMLLPIAGAITFTDGGGTRNLVAAGQVQVLAVTKGAVIMIGNPFNEQAVNFLQVGIKARPTQLPANGLPHTYAINERPNELINITPENFTADSLLFIPSIGKFKGRAEAIYQLQHKASDLFVFVLEGAFEVEGRLLHARDGLALWGNTTIDMEALSNNAIVLLIETPGKTQRT